MGWTGLAGQRVGREACWRLPVPRLAYFVSYLLPAWTWTAWTAWTAWGKNGKNGKKASIGRSSNVKVQIASSGLSAKYFWMFDSVTCHQSGLPGRSVKLVNQRLLVAPAAGLAGVRILDIPNATRVAQDWPPWAGTRSVSDTWSRPDSQESQSRPSRLPGSPGPCLFVQASHILNTDLN